MYFIFLSCSRYTFVSEINLAIGKGIRSSRPIRISGPLKSEIEHWTFLSLGLAYYLGALNSTIRLYCVQMPLLLHGAVSLTPPRNLFLFVTTGLLYSALLT